MRFADVQCRRVYAIRPGTLAAALATMAGHTTAQAPQEPRETATQLAWRKLATIHDHSPLFTVESVTDEIEAITLATEDWRIIDRFGVRLERAMDRGLILGDIGKAGRLPGRDRGYGRVMVFYVDRCGLVEQRWLFDGLC